MAFILLEDLPFVLGSSRVLDCFRLALLRGALLRLVWAIHFPSSFFPVNFLDASEELQFDVREAFSLGRFYSGAVDDVPCLKQSSVLVGQTCPLLAFLHVLLVQLLVSRLGILQELVFPFDFSLRSFKLLHKVFLTLSSLS